MNPDYPPDWFIQTPNRAFLIEGTWRDTVSADKIVEGVFLHRRHLNREPGESPLHFIHRAKEWVFKNQREIDISMLTDAFLHKQEADAKYRKEVNRVFTPGVWFEVKPFRGQKKPIAMEVDYGFRGKDGFSVTFRIPKKSGPGYLRRTVQIEKIGRQVAPPQENP